jgi:hypothetical protein
MTLENPLIALRHRPESEKICQALEKRLAAEMTKKAKASILKLSGTARAIYLDSNYKSMPVTVKGRNPGCGAGRFPALACPPVWDTVKL